MWKCDDCGKLVEHLDTYTSRSGKVCEDNSCPDCGCTLVKAEKCAMCGEYEYADDLVNGVCEECISKYTNLSNILSFVRDKNLKVEWRTCMEDFIEEHSQDFADWLKEDL